MLRIVRALLKIAIEVRRIREILEIAHAIDLEKHKVMQSYNRSGYLRDSELEVDSTYLPKLDAYGEVIEEE